MFDLKGSSRARYVDIIGAKPLDFDEVLVLMLCCSVTSTALKMSFMLDVQHFESIIRVTYDVMQFFLDLPCGAFVGAVESTFGSSSEHESRTKHNM